MRRWMLAAVAVLMAASLAGCAYREYEEPLLAGVYSGKEYVIVEVGTVRGDGQFSHRIHASEEGTFLAYDSAKVETYGEPYENPFIVPPESDADTQGGRAATSFLFVCDADVFFVDVMRLSGDEVTGYAVFRCGTVEDPERVGRHYGVEQLKSVGYFQPQSQETAQRDINRVIRDFS